MWWESSACLTPNSASNSHWHTGSGLRRRTSSTCTRSGSASAFATRAIRSASRLGSRPAAGAQQAAAAGPGEVGSDTLITTFVVLTLHLASTAVNVTRGQPAVHQRQPARDVLDHLELADGPHAGCKDHRADGPPGGIDDEPPGLPRHRPRHQEGVGP